MNLLKFCWPDEDTRPSIQKPFTRNGYTYAGDGGILVKVPQMDEWPDDNGPPLDGDFFTFAPGHREEAILNIPIRWDYETCDDELCLIGPPSMHCRSCFGTGFVLRSKEVVQHGGFKLNQIYVDKIRELKDLRTWFPDPFNPPKHEKDTCYFAFDGGCGLIMGMR